MQVTANVLKKGLRSGIIAGSLILATAVPAMADSTDCNIFGFNCRGSWDYGVTQTTAWSYYKQLDLTHGSSVFGTTQGGTRKMDTKCAAANVWANSSITQVISSRQAYYRDNC